jgi:hypothetical protein
MFAVRKGVSKLPFSMLLSHNFHKTSILHRLPTSAEIRMQKKFLEAVGENPTGKQVTLKSGKTVYGFGSANFPSTSFWKESGIDHPVLMNAANFKAVFLSEQKRDKSQKQFTPRNKSSSRIRYGSTSHSPMMFKLNEDTVGLEVSDGAVYVLDTHLNFALPSGEESIPITDDRPSM